MIVNMPANQVKILSPECALITSTSSTSCSSFLLNETSIKIIYANQTITTLLNIKNQEPNSNPLTLSMYTANN